MLGRVAQGVRPGAGLRRQLAAEHARSAALEEELRELRASLLRLSSEHAALRERTSRLLAEATEDTDRSIAAIEAAIAATQSSLFWRLKRKLRRGR